MKQDHEAFDDLIRQRIGELPPTEASGWDLLADRLDREGGADRTIADKLSGLAPAAPAGSWQAFEQVLAGAEADYEHAVDEAVATGLRQASPAAVSGWSQLAARLELTGKRREMVSCLKITEAALLLTLFLVFTRFGAGYFTAPSPSATAQAAAFPLPTEVASASTADLRPNASGAVTDGDSPAATPDPVQAAPVRPVEALELPPLAPLTRTAPPIDLQLSPIALERLPALDFGLSSLPPSLPLSLASSPALFGSEPVRYYLNAFVSPLDLNGVMTRANSSLGIAEQTKISTGYSVGALIEAEQSDNALQFGIVYGHRSYTPAKILLIAEDTSGIPRRHDIRYSRLTYETVSIPLNYQRVISSDDRWAISAGLGMSMNIVLGSEINLPPNYRLKDLNQLIEQAVADGNKPPEKQSARSFIDPTRGYFQGGGLLENSSLYVSGNLRIERLLTDRLSLYFSPTVGRLVTIRKTDGGKGPFEDRIHNTMLRFGTRVRLSGN